MFRTLTPLTLRMTPPRGIPRSLVHSHQPCKGIPVTASQRRRLKLASLVERSARGGLVESSLFAAMILAVFASALRAAA